MKTQDVKNVIVVGVVSVVGIGFLAASCSASATPPTPASTVNYNDVTQLDNSIQAQFNTLTPGGITASTVNCIASELHTFDCAFTLSNGSTRINSYVVSEDGQSFISKAGQ